MKTVSSLIAAASIAMVGLGTTAAHAANTGNTTTTFSLTAGTLDITVPATATLGSTTTGAASLANQALGAVTVTDGQGSLVSGWTATVASTDFVTGGSTANEKVVKANVAYTAGAGTALLGQVGAFVPATPGTALAAATTAGTWTGVGNNTVTWNPSVTFTLIPSQVAGTYTGTITHSVA
jgi:hypothetical protein